jgi:hypothetical protein
MCGLSVSSSQVIVADFRPKAINHPSGCLRGLAHALPLWRRMTRCAGFARLLVLLLLATPSIAYAADPSWDGLRRHLRTTDDRLRRLLELGTRTSPTFRALVHRLLDSDVIVYLWCDRADTAPSDGRLTFVSTAGGYRYVVVRLVRFHSRERQIAIMAHELRHAVEIADAPQVVDDRSLEREYRRIGYMSSTPTADRRTFDTRAAVDAGVQVMNEMVLADD